MQLSKRSFIACLVFFISFGWLNSQAQSFEGVIHYEFPGMGNNQMNEMAYMIKDSKVRMQFGQGAKSGAMIYLPDESKMVIIIDQMKAYMETEMNKQDEDDAYAGKWENSEMVKTGETKTIAGYSCQIWKVENDKDETLTMCMAEGLGTFMTPGNPMARQNAPAWAKEIVKEGYMPLEAIETSNGTENVQMRATRIESKSLDASLFKVPEGYRDMSAMLEQMKNMNKN